MTTEIKKEKKVMLIAAIEQSHYEALRFIAYKEKRSIADVTREALSHYITQKSKEYPIAVEI